jgi:flagellin
LDVAGEINGEEATGKGQVLTGNVGNANTDGLAIRYSGKALPGQPNPPDVPDSLEPAVQPTERDLGNLSSINAGTVTLAQNSLVFQIGSNAEQTSSLALRNMRTNSLGTGVENVSTFESLADIDVTGPIKAQDSMRVLDRALEEVSSTRGEIGAFQKNNLESNLNYLRIAHENVMSSESVIRDADMAEEMTKFTRNQIMVESSTAMLAQANARSESVLRLLNG